MKRKDTYWLVAISVVLFGFFVFLDYFGVFIPNMKEEVYSDTLIHEIRVVEEYGFDKSKYEIEKKVIRQNEFLADILVKRGLDYAVVDQLIQNGRLVFDPRKIKVGNPYAFVTSMDSAKSEHYFVYQESPLDYIVYELRDSLQVVRKQKEKVVVAQLSEGIIESSLWNSMVGQGLNPMLAVQLSDIYAWTIDFFGIQKGDSYKIYYDEDFVDSMSIGIGRIHAAVFNHNGVDYWAVGFTQDDQFAYYDDQGLSLKKAFLKAPLKFNRISSKFTNSRYHPVLKIRRPHHGVDYAAPTGTPVYSIGDGRVIDKGYQRGGGGNFVKVKHNSVYTTMYMHLHGFAKGLVVGDQVRQGELIGYVGSTGLSTGPHLDFRVYQNGKAVDPLKIESPPVEPVSKENRPTFDGIVRHWKMVIHHE
jgi:murein DD-endopeptidase MepM/ murein hydrolase activator NlpD